MRLAIYILIAAAVMTGAALYFTRDEHTPAIEQSGVAKLPATSSGHAPASAPGSTSAAPPAPITATDYRKLVDESRDMLATLESLHTLAKDGNAAAAYWLSKALIVCDANYANAFVVRDGAEGKELTVEDAMEYHSASRRYHYEELRSLHDKCKGAREVGLGKFRGTDWVIASSEGGYPLGQAAAAAQMVANSPGEPAAHESAKKLALEALRDGDGEVVMELSHLVYQLAGHDQSSSDQRAQRIWMVAACQRGADCGPQAAWVRQWCREDPECQPFETGLDLIRREVGGQFPELERRAREINELINARDWANLEFE